MFFNDHAPPHFHVQYAEYKATVDIQLLTLTSGKVRFEHSHLTGVFESLKDPFVFAQAHVDGGAVAWPGNLDLAPDAMYLAIKANGEWVLR